MSASWVTFLFEAANFLLLAAVLGWIFFRPVRDALERRRSELESEQRVAAEARIAAERERQEVGARRRELEGSLEERREELRRQAEAEKQQLLEAARAQMQRERERFEGELVALRRARAGTLAREAAWAARAIVVRLLGELQGPDLERALLAAAGRQLEKLRSSGPLEPVVIETARALDEELLGSLARAAGIAAEAAVHRVDPELVAGVRVVTARGLVDASVAGLAAYAEGALASRLEREGDDS